MFSHGSGSRPRGVGPAVRRRRLDKRMVRSGLIFKTAEGAFAILNNSLGGCMVRGLTDHVRPGMYLDGAISNDRLPGYDVACRVQVAWVDRANDLAGLAFAPRTEELFMILEEVKALKRHRVETRGTPTAE